MLSTTPKTRSPAAAVLSSGNHLLDKAFLKATFPLASHLSSLWPFPPRDATQHLGLVAALPGNLLMLGGKLSPSG